MSFLLADAPRFELHPLPAWRDHLWHEQGPRSPPGTSSLAISFPALCRELSDN